MPRETVTPAVGPFEVQVGWANDRDVQVAVTVGGEQSMFWTLFDSEGIVGLGIALRQLLQGEGESLSAEIADITLGTALLMALDVVSDSQYRGLWSTLDRRECNRLITLIRRARDAAFGKDE